MQIIKNMISTPDLGIQIVLILLTLTSENMRMDKRIDNMSVSIDKIRNVNEVINNSIQSLKVITELPKNVRHIMKCQRRIKFDRNAGWKLTHFAGGLKRRILLTPVRVSPVYPWWRYQPVAQSLSQLLTYPLICKFRREY